MENKLQELTKKLYDEGLAKGREQAEVLRADAEGKAKQIIVEAESKASKIIAAAEAKAEELRKNSLTEISLAGRQAVTVIKESIANLVIAKSISGSVASANMDATFIKDILVAVAQNWQGTSKKKIELKALLPANKEVELGVAFEKSIQKEMKEGLEITYSDNVKSGFRIEPKDGGFYISFSDADFDALLSEYLRPKVSEILYSKS